MTPRLIALRAAMTRAGADAVWLSRPESVRYFSNFSSPEDGKLLVLQDAAVLYTDDRYRLQVAGESQLTSQIARPPATWAHAAESVAGLRVGFEAEHLSVAALAELTEHWPSSVLLPLRGLVETLRVIKDEGEIAAIRKAASIADAAFEQVRPQIVPGGREVDIALALEIAMRRLGADEAAFDTIVASGVRGALPHGRASDKVMQAGELVTLDFGAKWRGYHSDMTRTLALGAVDGRLKGLYDAVLDAEETALAAVRPGVRAAELDRLARDVLSRHNLAEHFTHSLGHGVGLSVHEGPGLRSASQEVLQAGMVITIEPGVYLEGVGGVRIEDLVLVTESGHEVLSHAPKERL